MGNFAIFSVIVNLDLRILEVKIPVHWIHVPYALANGYIVLVKPCIEVESALEELVFSEFIDLNSARVIVIASIFVLQKVSMRLQEYFLFESRLVTACLRIFVFLLVLAAIEGEILRNCQHVVFLVFFSLYLEVDIE
jgi:hypothetical protein